MTTTTNKLNHTISLTIPTGTLKIKISLADDCKNGHADFSITGETYDKRGRSETGGCIHETILEYRPDLKLFVDLHLSDYKGAPMYAQANGFYHLKNTSVKVCQDYIRATDAEMDLIGAAEDELAFTYLLQSTGIVARWKSEASHAIKVLEEMTGMKYKDTSTKQQFAPLTAEQSEEVAQRIKNGYYTKENIQALENAKKDAANKAIRDGLKRELSKKTDKAQKEYNVKISVLDAGLSIDNFIYYDHTNEGCFNWYSSGKKVTQEQFDLFLTKVSYSKLPKNISFSLGKDGK